MRSDPFECVEDRVYDRARSHVHVRDRVGYSVYASVRASVSASVSASVGDSVRVRVWGTDD